MYEETGFAESDFAALDKNHDAGGSRDNFGETRQIEDRVDRHRLARRFNCACAVSLFAIRPVLFAQQEQRRRASVSAAISASTTLSIADKASLETENTRGIRDR
jgi:hypothetical protein